METKKIRFFKNKHFGVFLAIFFGLIGNVSAQTWSNQGNGTNLDRWTINDDNTNHWSHLRFQVGGMMGTPAYGWNIFTENNSLRWSYDTTDDHSLRGVEWMKLTSSGLLGLGISNPTVKLDVAGAIKTTEGFVVNGQRSAHAGLDGAFYRYSGQVYLEVDDNLYIRDTQLGDRFLFDTNNSRLGIGTSSPSVALDVNGKAKFSNIPEDNTLDRVLFTDAQGNIHYRNLSSVQDGNPWTESTGNITRGTGKVAIGTTGLSDPEDATTTLKVWGGDVRIEHNKQVKSIGILNLTADDDDSGDGTINFKAGGETRMTMNDSGDLGIGTSSPGAKLHVEGGEVRLPAGTGSLLATHFNIGGSGANFIRGNTFIADDGGNLGVGTSVASERLHVNGKVRIEDIPEDQSLADVLVKDMNGNIRYRPASSIDTDTQLSEAQVDAMVGNNGFITSEQDGDVNNELITDFNLVGNSLNLIEAGQIRTVDLSGFLDGSSRWTENSGNVSRGTGKVSIGTEGLSDPEDSTTTLKVWGGDVRIEHGKQVKSNGVLRLTADDDDSGDGIIHFKAGNDTTMTLLDNGNLGVGITSPAAKLEVADGEVKIPGGSDSTLPTHFNLGGNGANFIRGNTYIADNGGQVGIGTAVFSGTSDAATSLKVWGGDIRLEHNKQLKSVGILHLTADDDDSGDGVIYFKAGNDTRMTLLDNGNLGVGITSPAAKLEVADGEVKIPGGSGSTLPTHFNLGGNGANFIRGNTFIADDGGNLGVGTSAPTEKLHVAGKVRVTDIPEDINLDRVLVTDTNGNIRYRSASSIDTNTQLNEAAVDVMVANNGYLTAEVDGSIDNEVLKNVSLDPTGLYLRWEEGTNADSVDLSPLQDGNGYWTEASGDLSRESDVTIGTSSNEALFTVFGTVNADSAAFGVQISGASYAPSDQRFKRNVRNISGAMDLINRIEGTTYNYKEESAFKKFKLPQRKQFGFMAQSLKEVMPELVAEDEDGYLLVNYIGVIPVLVEALKEQNAQVEDLAQKVEELERLIGTASNPDPTVPSDLEESILPMELYQNVPNPFSEKTRIGYKLPADSKNVRLMIYDLQGNQLKTFKNLPAGRGEVEVLAGSLKAGMYIYSLITNGQIVDTKRMILTD